MRISIISLNNNKLLIRTVNRLTEISPQIEVNVFARDYTNNGDIKLTENVKFYSEMGICLKDADIILNLITVKDNVNTYNDLSLKYNVVMNYAKPILEMVGCYGIIDQLDKFALACSNSKALIINAGEPIDIITAYLNKAHNITSYGISVKADNVINIMLEATDSTAYKGKINYKLCGIKNQLWVAEIKDKKGKDLYPLIRDKAKNINLNVTRNDLTRDAFRSLAFYGYYHSANAVSSKVDDILIRLIQSIIKAEKETFYFNVVNNNNNVYGLDSEAVVQIPCSLQGIRVERESVNLPLQCILAITDYASAISLVVKSLITKSREIFIRTVKLDPYLASILNLHELQNLSEDILAIEKDLRSMLV